MPNLDHWQQTNGPAKGFPTSDYFKAVHDAIAARGIQPENWFQGDPWEGAVVLDENSLTNTRAADYDEVIVSWRVEQDCEPKHPDDFDGYGWYLVYTRGDKHQVREFATPLPYLAEPEQVADAVSAVLGARQAG